MKRYPPKIGDRLFSLNIGNAARHSKQELTPVIVTNVGRIYFYACKEGFYRIVKKYRLDNWQQYSEYLAESKLYATEQEYQDELETNRLYKEIRSLFESKKGTIALDDLKIILEILKPT